jgi:hypothetical protein
VIRQAISCDICGSEKKQTNHWFVAYYQGEELRVSGWNSRNRLRPGSRHLCGQTCLHKLVDDFMAKALAVRPPQSAAEESEVEPHAAVSEHRTTDTSLTSNAAHEDFESSARVIPSPMPITQVRSPLRMPVEILPAQTKPRLEEAAQVIEEPPSIASRNWRAEAWERERVREQRAERKQGGSALRRTSSK